MQKMNDYRTLFTGLIYEGALFCVYFMSKACICMLKGVKTCIQ